MVCFGSAGVSRFQLSWRTALFCLSISAFTACSDKPEAAQKEAANGTMQAPTASEKSITGEVPPKLLSTVIEKLADSENLELGDISVERAEFVIWPDGSLGCGQPGEMYTQAPVNGYWIVLKSLDRRFDYRASEKGEIRRCDQSHKLRMPVG